MASITESSPRLDGVATNKSWSCRIMHMILPGRPSWLWAVCLAAALAVVIWVLLDAKLADQLAWPGAHRGEEQSIAATERLRGLMAVTWRKSIGIAIAASAIVSGALLAIGVFFGPQPYRGLRALFALAALVAVWLGLHVSLSDLAWWATSSRYSHSLERYQWIANRFRQSWPAHDGNSPEVGPYMAYPVGRPSTLILLTPPVLETNGTAISSIDRSLQGALRFQLSGTTTTDWLEWHPPTSTPQSFVGGLLDQHELCRSADLGDGWFLVRYRE